MPFQISVFFLNSVDNMKMDGTTEKEGRDRITSITSKTSNITLTISLHVYLIIHGRYVPSFWTANPEFEDKKSIFD